METRKAFTLIELLVVIAVIALLLSILIPALNKAKNLAQGVACKGNMKNYTYAVSMYLDDNDGKFCDPDMCYFSQSDPYPVEAGLSQARHLRWCNGNLDLKSHPEYGGHLFRYLMDAKSFICPTYKSLSVRYSEDHFYADYGASLRHYEPWYNYTMNAYLGSPNPEIAKTVVKKVSQVKHPSTTFSFCEESALVDTQYNISGLNDTYMIPGTDAMLQTWLNAVGGDPWQVEPGPGTSPTFYDVVAGYHNAPSGNLLAGRGNCAFLDGHVDAHYRSETFPLAWPH